MADTAVKSNKPKNNAIRQQRLKAWQPILTPKNVLPTLFFIGISFIPIGIGLFIAATKVHEFYFEYTECFNKAPSVSTPVEGVPGVNWKFNNSTKVCTVEFEVKETFKKPVFFYYRLTSFYQNHRSYVKSFDSNQLLGEKKVLIEDLTSNCDPVRKDDKGNIYFPCGLIANSMFSDSFDSQLKGIGNNNYSLTSEGIAWPSDADKYGSREQFLKLYKDEINNKKLVPPPDWVSQFPEYKDGYYTEENFPDLKNWEHFQVWMRTAGLPNFRKLYSKNINQDLPKGKYSIDITHNYNVVRYGGTKSFVITTSSIIGGKNPFLGIAYMFVGFISLVFGVIFLIRHLYKPRKLGDHKYLSWNKASATTNTADNGDNH
ncbi:hypothetical protein BCR36DRAFT_331896 [Piromyces finnis]|uniref:Lem3/Cdc50 n=1 Tax=Piromyces finnis TaxID=1754191 RepID=A0A1Y1V3K5_9FUNG|nr:hypothetical protein BCR36DRAFT_331896 [Piromyces finnis]|eukprot:ORX46440.1 hypothetical protein BCR36DRAFT_331896 [Piromyces finnis]